MLVSLKSIIPLLFILLSCTFSWTQENSLIITSISAARSSPNGTLVKINGIRTVPSGYFASSIPFGYAIQDKTAGIYVVDTIEIMKGEYQIGDEIMVTGIRSEAYGL